MNTIKITTSQNIELEYDLAGLGERIVGRIIDMLIVVAYIVLLFAILYGFAGDTFIDRNLWVLIFFILPIVFYDLVSEILMNGQSVGKRVMNIKVVSIDGARPTLGQYLIRWLFRLVDFTLTSGLCALISVAVSARKQRVGDMVAATTLIRTTARTNIEDTIYTPTSIANYTVSFPEVIHLSDRDIQLVKEVILNVNKTGNSVLAYQAADKIKQTLRVQSELEPLYFLHVLMADYNHLTSKL